MAALHSQGRVGAQHQVKLKRWSEKVAREKEARAVGSPGKPRPTRRRGRLVVAKEKLRKLFR